jgi:hypothetical protein
MHQLEELNRFEEPQHEGLVQEFNEINYINHIKAERVRIIKEDKDPIHIYELLQKHFNQSISEIKKDYDIKLDIIKSRVFIKGSYEKIYILLNYLQSKGIQFESISIDQLRIDLDHFLNKIF